MFNDNCMLKSLTWLSVFLAEYDMIRDEATDFEGK